MADLSSDIRLAVDSGEVAIGVKEATASVMSGSSKLVVFASKNKDGAVQDIMHISKVANVRAVQFDGDSMQLGAVCGKPYSVSMISVIKEGDSKILEDSQSK